MYGTVFIIHHTCHQRISFSLPPEHKRIAPFGQLPSAVILRLNAHHGVFFNLLPVLSIPGNRHPLLRAIVLAMIFFSHAGIKKFDFSIMDIAASGITIRFPTLLIRCQRYRLMLPVQQILACCVPPVQIPPMSVRWVVLEKQMMLPFKLNKIIFSFLR